MNPNPKIQRAIFLGSSDAGIAAARAHAKARYKAFPHSGCAAFLSSLLQDAGLIDLQFTLGAQALADLLEKRGWKREPVSHPQAGDVAVCESLTPPPGADHVFLILEVMPDKDLVRIADNQSEKPHFRHLSGQGTTPAAYLLRAPA
jgi:hypothetical protein